MWNRLESVRWFGVVSLIALSATFAGALDYPYAPYNEGKMDPQLTGWPLTDAEMAWVAKGEYTRKPGHEVGKHLPEMWFITPTAAHWGKAGEENVWVAHHATCIENVRAMKDGIDIALLGDSITQAWGVGRGLGRRAVQRGLEKTFQRPEDGQPRHWR